ncbi:DUF1015 domain-containing protein [Desulforegula conservatrix]|uniref:DUF1015 domain-containing protein n=1 Tax=Desulforegula conservatrix TaxID=153026 RepID=UPI0004115C6C|nr:DUF1015 domain-containing protein [Desulforegula conservatrix]
MADVFPFRGVLYNPEKIQNLSEVVAPPYDVISPEEQESFYARNENNVIRLILGKATETDSPDNNPHTRAAAFLKRCMDEGILVQDSENAMYVTSVEFDAYGKKAVRYGLIARVKLETFDKGVILPHEKTFSKVKTERLGLMKNCKVNDSQIFSLYRDHSGIFSFITDSVKNIAPVADIYDDKNERHKLWKLTDKKTVDFITEAMKKEVLYIADGHHRYETGLNYREFLKSDLPGFDETHPANYIMMYLSSMADPGLVIFPTHRVFPELKEEILGSFEKKAAEFFDIKEFQYGSDPYTALATLGEERAKALDDCPSIGVAIKDKKCFYLLTLKKGVMESKYPSIPACLRHLDVTVLTNLIISDVLGLDPAALDNEKLLVYTSYEKNAADMVLKGDAAISFLLSSTKMKQVQDVAENGDVMPRKTTYFYPKALTGLVMHKLTV